MKKDLNEWKPGIAATVVELLLIGVFFTIRLLNTQAARPILLSLCDGFCIAGLLYLFWALLTWASDRGELDSFYYMCRIAANMLASERTMQGKPRFISYLEFRDSREPRKRNRKPIILLGGASFAVSLVLFLIYKLLP